MLLNNDPSMIASVERKEDIVDDLESEIAVYLAEMAQQNITKSQGLQLAGYFHAINDIERIGDHAQNIAQLCEEKIEDNYPFSKAAVQEVDQMYHKTRAINAKAINAFQEKDLTLAREVMVDDNEIDRMEKRLRDNHIARVNVGDCFPPSGVIYLDILANLERIGDHSTNLAQTVLGEN